MANTPMARLDLAPKLKRPLSLWNPLDYLRLLYWVFYFPQALRWYVNTFFTREDVSSKDPIATSQRWLSLWVKPALGNLLIQGIFLTLMIGPLFCRLLEQLGVEIVWTWLAFYIAYSLAGGLIVGLIVNWTRDLAFGVTVGVAVSIALGVVGSIVTGIAFGVTRGMAGGVTLGVTLGVILGMGGGAASGVALGVTFGVAAKPAVGSVVGIVVGIALGVGFTMTDIAGDIALGIALCLSLGISFSRIDAYAIGYLNKYYQPQDVSLLFTRIIPVHLSFSKKRLEIWLMNMFPRITPIQLSFSRKRLEACLSEDWKLGLSNTNEMLRYSYQFIPAINALLKILETVSADLLISRTAEIAHEPVDWRLIHLLSAPFGPRLRIRSVPKLASYLAKIYVLPGLDTLPHATAAGFWYLHEQQAQQAARAFDQVRSITHGEEMYQLAWCLSCCQALCQEEPSQTIKAMVNFDLLSSLQFQTTTLQFGTTKLLRPTTWWAINAFRRTIEDTQLIYHSVAKVARSLALNRAIGELTQILQTQDQLPDAERDLIVEIAQTWKTALEPLALNIGQVKISQPIGNPYIIGDPVLGESFAGRDDIMRQLEELWSGNQSPQSIVLFGHRRMGKTSILRNAMERLSSQTQVIYMNLQRLGIMENGMGEVLLALSDEISDATGIAPPNDQAFLQLPQRTFERYLKTVLAQMIDGHLSSQNLIIALDEFETLETLIQQEQLAPSFLGYLRGLVQMHPNLAFAFAGLHTLEEMTADYFQPFFASVIPIRVRFLSRAATAQLLASPSHDFPLDYHPEALAKIHDLTHGQPYLSQLIGFLLVRRYNDFVFEQGRQRDNRLTVADVEAVVTEHLFRQGRYYFDGVWQQAAQGAPGQQMVMKILADDPQGLTTSELLTQVGGELEGQPETLGAALETLAKHDVIEQNSQGSWQITVEILRIWLQNYAPAVQSP
jgi:hypothetical protein